MPKMKTHSGASKRIKKNKNKLFKAAKAGRRHLLTKKTSKKKQGMRRSLYINSSDINHIIPLLPY